MGLRALIADDHALFRDGLKAMLQGVLEFEAVEQAGSLDEALEILGNGAPPDLLVVDLRMPGVSGAEAFHALRDAFPTTKVVVMSASEDRADIIGALSGRVNGYVPKSLSATDVESALKEVLAGRVYVPAILTENAAAVAADEDPKAAKAFVGQLTERQQDVLNELLKGRSSKHIARELNIAEGTVKIHLAAIYRTIGVKTRAEAIAKLSARR
jgi:DNA-binding NarL/FixJ family response regulator